MCSCYAKLPHDFAKRRLSFAALSSRLLAEFKLFGMTMFDLFDFSTSNILLPLGGLFLALFSGWAFGRKNRVQVLTNHATLQNTWIVTAFFFVIRFVTPVLVLLILLHGLGVL